MHTTNVRELKKNPSLALRLARDGPVLILKGSEPEALLVHLDKSLAETEAGLRPALAASLYNTGSVSLGKAAKISGLSLSEWEAWGLRSSGGTRQRMQKPVMFPQGLRHNRRRNFDRSCEGRRPVRSARPVLAHPDSGGGLVRISGEARRGQPTTRTGGGRGMAGGGVRIHCTRSSTEPRQGRSRGAAVGAANREIAADRGRPAGAARGDATRTGLHRNRSRAASGRAKIDYQRR